MDRARRRELREMVDRWCEDADRVRTVDTRLKAVGVGSVDVIAMLREVGERALVELSEVELTGLEQELDNRLADLIDQMTSGLRDLRVIEPDQTYRRDHTYRAGGTHDVSADMSQDKDEISRVGMAMWRTLLESSVMRLARNREWVAAGVLNRLNIEIQDTLPSDERLPKPLQGATLDQAKMWPALWLAGRRDVFPRNPGRDPRRALRGQLLRQLHDSWNGFLTLSREKGEVTGGFRGN